MTHKQTLQAIEKIWERSGAAIPFPKFILDAFAGEGLAGFYLLPNTEMVRKLKQHYNHIPKGGELKHGG